MDCWWRSVGECVHSLHWCTFGRHSYIFWPAARHSRWGCHAVLGVGSSIHLVDRNKGRLSWGFWLSTRRNTIHQVRSETPIHQPVYMYLYTGRGLEKNEAEWTAKAEILEVGEASTAIFWPTPCFKEIPLKMKNKVLFYCISILWWYVWVLIQQKEPKFLHAQ